MPVAFPVDEARSELAAGNPVMQPASQSFWFAWSQFHPGTLRWRAP